MTGVLLGIYLFRAGLSSFAIGLVIGVGLAGAALATVVVSLAADGFGRRRSLVVLSLLSGIGAIALVIFPSLPVLLLLAFVGMLNGTGTDRSASHALDQAVIPGLGSDSNRTWNLAIYNALLDGGGSLGALVAGLPILLQHRFSYTQPSSYRFMFLAYGLSCLLVAVVYLLLSPTAEVANPTPWAAASKMSAKAKTTVTKLTALFSLDAFGGGFLTDALVSYWFYRRFGVSEGELGLVFFAVHILNAFSHLGAAWLALRIGLVNTMVFTHLPSSLFLMAVPFAFSFKWAVVLFLCREALVEMDVPTRQSYVAAVVSPGERTFASGMTNLARNVFWSVGSTVAGVLMQSLTFSAPLLVGAGAKITYDVVLYGAFRKVKPPEEEGRPLRALRQ